MYRKALLIPVIVVTSAALLGAVWVLTSTGTGSRPKAAELPPTTAGPSRSDLALLLERLAEQEQALIGLRAEVEALDRKLEAALRSRFGDPLSATGRVPVPVPNEQVELDPLDDQGRSAVRALQDLALDPTRPVRDRVLAVRRLWYIDLETGLEGSITPEIVDAQLALLLVEPDADLRRQVCFNVLDRTEPRHAALLLDVLAADAEAEVRAQAADTLQTLLQLPDVRAALEWASLHDPSELVRSTAAEMLARWDPGSGG